ncbi:MULTISPECIES: hypothetical protein [Calothrix]|uniref:Uncharacterized protein n=2 Tax=Calothrix TaxID=1186 RepID=A0ABR8AC32_9CYAN|nr:MULTISPECIES: hypothetical protein [Calothrix]MBD2197582.1 hypothetical protein [Calothrix parietina FACHB-288]MBD2227462.1 hypothetical protein [Calothrix anomala FACHB-343]
MHLPFHCSLSNWHHQDKFFIYSANHEKFHNQTSKSRLRVNSQQSTVNSQQSTVNRQPSTLLSS